MKKKDTEKQNQNFYFTIHSFMTRELGLRGSALIIYAIIYALSDDVDRTFYGSREFLADYAGVSLSTVGVILKKLIEEDFITVVSGEDFGRKEYRCNRNKIASRNRNLPAGQPKSTCEAAENHLRGNRNLPAGQPKSSCYNKDNNKYNNKLIFNSYNDADAEREKEKIIFSENADKERYGKKTLPNPVYKYCSFDPNEAFLIALERTEQSFKRMNEKGEAESGGENNST